MRRIVLVLVAAFFLAADFSSFVPSFSPTPAVAQQGKKKKKVRCKYVDAYGNQCKFYVGDGHGHA